MSFTSITFAAFCLAVLALYWLVQHKTWQNLILVAASYVFYGWIHPWYLILLGLSTLADYFLASGMSRFRERARIYLTFSLVLNLGVLAFFKYYNFFNDTLAARLGWFGLDTDVLLVSLVLPAGLSFYTLKKLSYILDVSRGTLKPSENLVDFALYVSFFPQIISGPIDRPQKLFPQIEAARRWQADFFTSAWPLILMGIFKKVVVADTIKSIVDRIFSLQTPSKLMVLAAALGFTLQILADFSAYTDISRGIARLFGFATSENFRTPYLSLTPSEFWNRWHITLSNFLRDYIFFPLRRALLRKRTLPSWLVNVLPPLVTMFVSGLWHGAGWTYLAWGLYYGFLIVAYQSAGIQGEWKLSGRLKTLGAWLLMFSLIVFGWLLFRAPSLAWVGKVLFQFPLVTTSQDFIIVLVVLSMAGAYSLPLLLKLLLGRYLPENSWGHAVYYALITLAIIIYTNSSNPDFIYFQF
jgi:D-alanyl-lipoteichoic acid acyltransferase DltB (MBOAT superfamily)